MLTNPNMLKSERFRTTVKDPPFAFDYMEGKDVGNKSKDQIEREEFKEIIKQREKMPAHIKASMVHGDIIIPSEIDTRRSTAQANHNHSVDLGRRRNENITPYEVLSLI